MFIDMDRGRPLRCSKCGSANALRPMNSRTIEVQCGDCGHTKLTPDAQQREWEREHPDLAKSWTSYKNDKDDKGPTF